MQDGERTISTHFKVKRSKVTTELCQYFGSDAFTWEVFNVHLSYFIHTSRCMMVRGRYLYILRSKVKITDELCHYICSDKITWVIFNKQLLHFIHSCWLVRGRYLYILRSGVKIQGHNQTSNYHSDKPLAGPFLTLSVFYSLSVQC